MVINTKSSDVDAHGRVLLNCLSNWKIGWSNLSIVLEEMVAAFQRETPLFVTYPTRTPSLPSQAKLQPSPFSSCGSWPHAGSSSTQKSSAAQHGVSISTVNQHANNTLPKSTKSQSCLSLATGTEMSGERRSYTQVLLDFGITFGAQALEINHQTNPFISSASDAEQALKLPARVITMNEQQFLIQLKKCEDIELRGGQNQNILFTYFLQDCNVQRTYCQIPGGIQVEKVEMFQSILSLERCRFSPTDVLEAVRSCWDLDSALKYLSHDCPICQEQVSFNRMITMTHCSCTFCESCFKKYFSSVIKEKCIVHAVCPICNLPDLRGGHREESVEYFSLLETQWAPQHQGISCEKFKEWEQLNSPEYQNSRLEQLLSRNIIDCPKCKCSFFLARGGCLHFKCTQCQHEFCGGCSQPFKQGSRLPISFERLECPKTTKPAAGYIIKSV
ncbi:uncharacterized protein LOC127442368 isoform X3 [Myxocyprinus asiaticus]|uniref:uncharacterized protein LOC127442368 isoform X3 n=1 Tax=Myxocyprinus asiaticus TaxID=70543 RepID=UPI00222394AE|nr:uncharacterized protein LOC127442368 isoform X3 [Myxocyprinus asiaticus]